MNLDILNIAPSPIELIENPIFDKYGVRVYVKRDDLIHPSVQGNKWRKLKYNLMKIKELNISSLLTFGGAFSNHIHATAAAGQFFGINTIGIIRGEKTVPLSNTLIFAEKHGMKLHFVSREEYKNKTALTHALNDKFGDVYVLPEGGTNDLAVMGSKEIVKEINQQIFPQPDFLAVACGTGGTIAGMIKAANEKQTIIGFAVLKGDFLHKDVSNILNLKGDTIIFESKNDESLKKSDISSQNHLNWSINNDYHFGGYAKFNPELIEFINRFKALHGISLDPIYTGKMFFGLFDLIKKGYFPRGSTIVAVHTGGLQGIEGFNDFKLKNSPSKIL